VSDSGIGIAVDHQAWIFEAFAQAETGIHRKFGGTGLGLTIAKQLAIRLGGDLTVESAPGAGSAFSVVLPIGGPPSAEETARRRLPEKGPMLPPVVHDDDRRRSGSPAPYRLDEADAGAPSSLDGKTVMIVDDDMRNVYSLSNALRGKRLRVVTAADGQEALDELERTPVDLVVMDVMMPRLDGYEATRRIRAHERLRDLPVIALTARTMAGEREKCIAAGASDYLPKPVDFPQLLHLLRKWLGPTGDADREPKRRAGAGLRVDPDPAAELLDGSLAQREADAGTA
jgi:two-component system, chemotaxis family, sensor kinase CheA